MSAFLTAKGGHMPLVAISIKLDRIEEELLYRDPGGGVWLSAVCTLEEDSRGRMVVAQSIPKERYAAGEKGPPVGIWREIGRPKPPAVSAKGFDLGKFKAAAAQHKAPGAAKYHDGQEGFFPPPQAAFDAAQREQQRENKPS
jgi:hypothetical protein